MDTGTNCSQLTGEQRNKLQQMLQAKYKETNDLRYRDKLFESLGRLPWIIGDQQGWPGGELLGQAFMTHCLASLRWDPKRCASYGRYYSHRLKTALMGEARRKNSLVIVPKRTWESGDRPLVVYLEEQVGEDSEGYVEN